MAANGYEPAVSSSWIQLDLGSQINHETLKEATRLLQTAWLLLLATYTGDTLTSCYSDFLGEDAPLELLSLSIESSSTLEEHASRISASQTKVNEGGIGPSTMVWHVPELDDWKAHSHALFEHANLEFILLLDAIQKMDNSTQDDRVEISISLLFNQRQAKIDEQEAIGRSETLKRILSAMVESPTSVLGDTCFLSDHDRDRILAWNRPAPGTPVEMTIPSGFAVKVKDRPEAPAIYAWDGEMTYLELDLASSELASLLYRQGRSGPDNMVLFNMAKSKWALIAALAILKSGKAIVPTDPSWPQSRLEQIVEITGARLAVCDDTTKGTFGADKVREMRVPPSYSSLHTEGTSPFHTPCLPNDLAFVLFSSGSTGVPKGMLRQHDTACTGSFAHAKAMHLDSTSRVLQFANHVFDVAMLDFFTTLLMGGCVCIPSEVDRKNDLAGFIERSQANWALLTPTVASLLDPITVPSLKFMTLGGESINQSTLQKWLQVCRVGVNYGSAEVDVTHTRDFRDDSDISNVGQRLPSCTAYIVDPNSPDIILPVGAIGELVISGPTMARGYLNAPEKTAEVFMPVPGKWISQGILEQEGLSNTSRIYRMGDLCRQISDGSFTFVGRKDFQVKVSGQKVELGDVESKLLHHPAVKQCAVLYPVRGPYTKRLVAMVQSFSSPSQMSRHSRAAMATGSLALDLRSITDFLSKTLPSFMLPTVFVGLTDMPYTATMKIDRNRLKGWLMEEDIRGASQGVVCQISTALDGPLLSPHEEWPMEISKTVADVVSDRDSAIWKSIAGHDNSLADIGVNSAQMMRLSHVIGKRFGTKVLVEMLGSEDMTMRKLATLLIQSNAKTGTQPSSSSVEARVAFLKDRVAETSRTLLDSISGQPSRRRNIFLTGASGYLGVQILVQLLQSRDIGSVTVLVRSANEHQALEKVKYAMAAVEEPVRHEDLAKLRAWPGDLSQIGLGLSETHSTMLYGFTKHQNDKPQPIIDSIIHCGAVVDWRKSYDELEAANVISTKQLLSVALSSPDICRFVFISGGRYPDPTQKDGQGLAQMYIDTAKGNGYAQTKFVAEQLVDEVRHRAHCSTPMDIISPAYLIGSQRKGLANQDDYLWRIVWASVRVGAFNVDENDQWLFVAESNSVAERIVALTLGTQTKSLSKGTTLQVFDGLSMREFWRLVCNVLGVALSPVSGAVWLQKVRNDMDDKHDHLLWPLADAIDASYGKLTQGRCLSADMGTGLATAGIELAIQRNLERLKSESFFEQFL